MSFVLTAEQEQFRQAVRQFMQSTSSPAEVRRLMTDPAGFDRGNWHRMADELGLQALLVPEKYDGAGAGWVEVAVVLEEAGRTLHASPLFASAVLATTAIIESGDDEALAERLPGLGAGARIATLAWCEEGRGWDLDATDVRARATTGGFLISGRKTLVLDGGVADDIIVSARTPAGLGLFAVAGDAAGLTRTPLVTMDLTRRFAQLDFSDVPARLIGTDGGAEGPLTRTLDRATIALTADQVGGAQAALAMSVSYAKDRVQFGNPIGTFQAIKHQCADMLLLVETATSTAYHAAGVADDHAHADEPPPLTLIASTAKAYCSDAYLNVAARTIQIHGGIGFTWEHDGHLHLRRAKSNGEFLGGPAHHRARVANLLGI